MYSGEHTRITLGTRNVFIDITATDLTKVHSKLDMQRQQEHVSSTMGDSNKKSYTVTHSGILQVSIYFIFRPRQSWTLWLRCSANTVKSPSRESIYSVLSYNTVFRYFFSRLHSVECVEVENPDGSMHLYPVSDKYFILSSELTKEISMHSVFKWSVMIEYLSRCIFK